MKILGVYHYKPPDQCSLFCTFQEVYTICEMVSKYSAPQALRKSITISRRPQPLWLDSNEKASGKAGAVQTIELIEPNYYMQKTYSAKSGY